MGRAYPLCTSATQPTGHSEAVRAILAYAMGLLRAWDRAERMAGCLERLHLDEDLYVVQRIPLPADCRNALRRSWHEIGYECRDQIVFLSTTSPRWKRVWAARCFERETPRWWETEESCDDVPCSPDHPPVRPDPL